MEFLSQLSSDRRTKQNIALDSLDLPVSQQYVAEIGSTGVQVLCTSKWLNTVTIRTDSAALVEQVKALSFVDSVNLTWVEPELKGAKIKLETLEPVMNFDYGVSLSQVAVHNGQWLHKSGHIGEGKLIAVLDAGFLKVNELKAFDSLWHKGQILGTRDFVAPGGDVFAEHSHGMAVLSVMGGQIPGALIGTAPGADYFLIRTEDNASEYPVEMDYWIAGAELADSLGADLINSSLGYSVFDNDSMNYTIDDLDGNTIRVTIGADIAASRGILVVTSAVNEGNKSWQKITVPADGNEVLAVGSVHADSTYSSFSSRGPSADGRVKPDVMGVGSSTVIQYSSNTIGTSNGTSFSGPLVTGMAASLWSALPELSAAELRDLIKRHGDRYTEPSDTFGYGIPDFYQAWLSQIVNNNAPENNELLVYPNPLQGNYFYLRLPGFNGEADIKIFSADGRLLMHSAHNGSMHYKIEISEPFEPGLYIVNVTFNNKRLTAKLIKN